ncbi:MAG: hypothetical protein KAY32_14875 [Candidatus Eisenbacteria sp.]|nr:hypothetical protein [Candidatus Eisenbacteria bacterium]
MKVRFSDGMELDTSGKLRVVHRKDGWYVVGQGMLAAVDDPKEGERLIEELRQRGGKNDAFRSRRQVLGRDRPKT